MARHHGRLVIWLIVPASALACVRSSSSDDPGLERFALRLDRESIEDPQLLLRALTTPATDPAGNITRAVVRASRSSITVKIETAAPANGLQQYAVHLDTDRDGEGDAWVIVHDVEGHRAILADNQLVVNTLLDVRVDQHGRALEVVVPARTLTEIAPLRGGRPPPAVFLSIALASGAQVTQIFQLGELLDLVSVPVAPAPSITLVEAVEVKGLRFMSSKKVPVEGMEKSTDADGNEIRDWQYTGNTREYRNADGTLKCRFETWALDLGGEGPNTDDVLAIRVVHADGTQGWIARCPYEGGDNFALYLDTNEDEIVDFLIYSSTDTGADDDRDGREDMVAYLYYCDTRTHVADHREDERSPQGHTATHVGPHARYADLEPWK
jgi:hypothetical protein